MPNRTVKDAKSIRGTNPQYLIEKIIRTRIYDCKYWKEECFALSAELLVDKAISQRYVGGVYGGAFYIRLVGSSLDCYKYLEPLLADSRKLCRQKRDGYFDLIHMDEYIDELLREERAYYSIILPKIQKRHVLEENNELEAKVSAIDNDFVEGLESSEDEVEAEKQIVCKEKCCTD